jgi:phage terminase large subunit-like protein
MTSVFDTEITLNGKPGRAFRVAAAAPTAQGQRPTAAIFDEVHELTGSRERVHTVLASGTAKRRGAFQLNISTAGFDPETLLGRLYAHGLAVNAGEIEDDSFLMTWYAADPEAPLKTREDWVKAVMSASPAAGDFLDVDNVVSRCMGMPLGEAKRYHLNLFSVGETIWEVAGLWPGLRSDLELDHALPLFVGLDIGVVHDSSAVVWCQKIEGKYVLRAKVWDNPLPVWDSHA